LQLLKIRCYGNQFGGKSAYLDSLIALAFHSRLEDHNTDRCVDTGSDSSTSDINLVSLGSVTLEFTRLVCVLKGQNYAFIGILCPCVMLQSRRGSHWALPRIYVNRLHLATRSYFTLHI